jgi:hypothetical protein
MWDRITVPLGIENSLRNIFGAMMLGGIDRTNPANVQLITEKVTVANACRPRFSSDFVFNIFYNNYAIFYEIFETLQVRTFTVEQLQSIVETNRDLILDSPYIDKKRYSMTESGNIASDDDIINAVSSSLVDDLISLSMTYVTEEEFRSSCRIYIDWYKNTFAEFTTLNMASIMSDVGFDVKKPGKRVRHYQGLEDMQEYYNENMHIIKSLSEESRIHSFVLDEKWLSDELQSESKQDNNALFTIGIKEIDATVGELRRGNMLGVMGPPKGGKTRFTNYLVQRALSMGLNVCVWPLEGTSDEWEAMQISCFLAQSSYNDLKSRGKSGAMIRISSKDIIDKRYINSPEIRKQVAGAKQIMATSPQYGRLSFIEGTAYVEDFLDVLEAHYQNENQFDILVIDQLVNIMSKKGKGKVERISEAYMETKNFLANRLKRPALGIMPAQLKQDVVDFLRRNPEETIDVTSGGESAETVRTPDEVIGLFSSKEERDNNIMKIYSVASRHNGSFQDFQCRCYLESCFFLSQDEDIQQ